MKKKLTALALSLTLVLGVGGTALAASDTFTDVPSTYWASKYIAAAAANGWVSGVGDGKYNPNGTVTFAQYVVMLTRAFYPEEVAKAKVEHTEISDWWYPYAYVADEHGILTDTEVGMDLHNPNLGVWNTHVLGLPISRYDMAILMANVLGDKGYTVTEAEKAAAQAKISDWAQIGNLYQKSVASVYALGVITGTSDGSFNGKGNMTRAQAAVTLYRLADVINNGGAATSDTSKNDDEVQQPTTGNTQKPAESNSNQSTAVYAPADTNHDGILTEEEVYDALMKFQQEYPTGTAWGDDKYYRSPAMGGAYACAAFAYMASDQAFNGGKRVVSNAKDIRVGDMIHDEIKGHWYIVTKTDNMNYYKYEVASGNNAGTVFWDTKSSYETTQRAIDNGLGVIYTRYPA